MERLFPASFAYIFLAALTTMAFSCKSDNKSDLMLDVERNPNNPRKWLALAEALEYVDMKPEADQARLAVHYTSALKNK